MSPTRKKVIGEFTLIGLAVGCAWITNRDGVSDLGWSVFLLGIVGGAVSLALIEEYRVRRSGNRYHLVLGLILSPVPLVVPLLLVIGAAGAQYFWGGWIGFTVAAASSDLARMRPSTVHPRIKQPNLTPPA